LDVLRVSVSGSLVNELYEYVGTVAIVAFFVAFLTFEPKKYFLKFVNFVRYIEMDLKNDATPETFETTVAAGTSSSWDSSNSRDPIHSWDPQGRNKCNQKNSNNRIDSRTIESWTDRDTQPLQGHQNQWNWKHLKLHKNENFFAPILNFVLLRFWENIFRLDHYGVSYNCSA
jgi:hypothetical protein